MTSFILNSTSSVARSLLNGEFGIVNTAGVLSTAGTAVTMAGGSDLLNLGLIRTTNTSSGANAITLTGSGAEIDNQGSIRGGTGAGSDAIEFNAAGRLVTNLLLTNAGDIRAFASGGSGIALSTGGSVINNSGTIRSAAFNAISISDLNGGASGTRIINSGTITPDLTGRNAILIINNDADRLENTGLVNGRVDLSGGNDVVVNSGTINGNLIMGDGNDLITNTGNIGFRQIDATSSSSFAIIMGNGNDTIDSGGSDVRIFANGGAGDDVYIIGTSNSSVVEENDLTHVDFGGNDRVETFVDFFLQGLANNVETLTLRGTALNGGGGSIANTINGNELNNGLIGNDGNDTIFGNAGNDILLGGGNDDRLVGGQGNDNLFGGDQSDVLLGDGGLDVLMGGAGADVLDGGAERDVASYANSAVGLRADLQVAATNTGEAAGDSYFLVEDLTGSAHDDILVGDSGGNLIVGSFGNDGVFGRLGNDTLQGGDGADSVAGGAGADDLSGGAGQDSFIFDSGLGAGQVDRILDFVVADDTFLLDDAAFAALALGQLAATAFTTGTAATLASHRMIHDTATGRVLFDADGVGGAAAIEVASISLGLVLTSADFLVF